MFIVATHHIRDNYRKKKLLNVSNLIYSTKKGRDFILRNSLTAEITFTL